MRHCEDSVLLVDLFSRRSINWDWPHLIICQSFSVLEMPVYGEKRQYELAHNYEQCVYELK